MGRPREIPGIAYKLYTKAKKKHILNVHITAHIVI